jgi:hypothetical protein
MRTLPFGLGALLAFGACTSGTASPSDGPPQGSEVRDTRASGGAGASEGANLDQGAPAGGAGGNPGGSTDVNSGAGGRSPDGAAWA